MLTVLIRWAWILLLRLIPSQKLCNLWFMVLSWGTRLHSLASEVSNSRFLYIAKFSLLFMILWIDHPVARFGEASTRFTCEIVEWTVDNAFCFCRYEISEVGIALTAYHESAVSTAWRKWSISAHCFRTENWASLCVTVDMAPHPVISADALGVDVCMSPFVCHKWFLTFLHGRSPLSHVDALVSPPRQLTVDDGIVTSRTCMWPVPSGFLLWHSWAVSIHSITT